MGQQQSFGFASTSRATRRRPDFDGSTFSPALDAGRLGHQLDAVRRVMGDGRWHQLAELAAACGCSEASASARLRDLRKPRFGGHVVERRRVPGGNGLHEYAMDAQLEHRGAA